MSKPIRIAVQVPDLVREGSVWALEDRVDVEAISPLRYMFAPKDRAKRCLEQIVPDFASRVAPGDILVAGRLFGQGPGHDHANLALKETGLAGVVARSIAPQFFRHSIDHGLLVAECAEILELAPPGCRLRVDFETGRVENLDSGESAVAKVPEGPALEVVRAGGLIPFIREQMSVWPRNRRTTN